MKFLALLFFLSSALASDKTDVDWRRSILENQLTYNDQAYCFSRENENLEGVNVDQKVRLASVSKLATSLWTLETLGSQHKFATKLYIKKNQLHLAGSFDPFMGDEKMFFLLSQLNDLGHTHFDKITFDKNFILFPRAQEHIEVHPTITSQTIAKNLLTYFNTSQWTTAMKESYAHVQKMAAPGRMRPEVYFDVANVEYLRSNPLENDEDTKILTLSSPPLYRYLKEMNVESNNYVAQSLFSQLGGEKEFQAYLKERFNLEENIIHFYNGSGLPVTINKIRFDNYATCESILTLIEALKNAIEFQGETLEDILAVPGSDQGTFRNRTFPADYKNSFMAKTGTLMHTSTLAGVMSTQKGLTFWGIFNQGTNLEGAKKVQNAMVGSLMSYLGGPKVFDYKITPFETYGDDDIKNLLHLKSQFLPIEENLY